MKYPTLAKVFLASFTTLILPCDKLAAIEYTWQGGSGNWTDANWTTGTGNESWLDGNSALFNGATDSTITISATVGQTGVTINDNANWTFVGIGFLEGSGALTKNGTGKLTISGGNSNFSGDVIATGGTIVISGSTAAQFGATTVTSATLTLDPGSSLGGAGTITLNSGGTLAINSSSSAGGTVTKDIVLNGGSIAFSGGNSSKFTGAFSGGGDLLMNTSTSYGNKLTIDRTSLSLNNTYTGNTRITNNTVEFKGYNNTDFNPFGTNASATVYLRSQTGSYGPSAVLIFNPGATSVTFNIAQKFDISANNGTPLTIQNTDGYLHFQGAMTLNSDASSAIKFITQYGGKDIWLDGKVSGSANVVITDISGNYAEGAVRLTNNTNDFTGTYTVDKSSGAQGILSVDANNAAATANIVLNDGRLRVNSGNVTIASLSGSNTSSSVYNADATARTLTINSASDATYAGKIGDGTANGNNLSLVKTGSGALVLSGANTYTGATTVNAGKLIINGTTNGTNITVNSSATLGGAGTITGNVVIANGAFLAPGNSTGTLHVAGNVTLQTGAKLLFEIAADGSFDQLSITTGTLNIEGNVELHVDLATGAPLGDYNFFGASTADWSKITITGVDPSMYNWNSTTGVFTVIPEPSTYGILAGVSLLGLIALRRRKQR